MLRAFAHAPDRAVHARASRRRAARGGRAVGCSTWPARACSAARSGLLAAAIEAVAFLPVFYAHLALNDVPTLAPLTLSLLGTRGRAAQRAAARLPARGDRAGSGVRDQVHRRDRARAAAARPVGAPRYLRRRSRALPGAGACWRSAVLADRRRHCARRVPRSRTPTRCSTTDASTANWSTSPRCPPKPRASWAPPGRVGSSTTSGRSPGGSAGCRRWRRSAGAVTSGAGANRRSGWLLVPAPLLFLAFMGLQGRYFGRWLLPILPILCLLAAFFALQLATRRRCWAGCAPPTGRAWRAAERACALAGPRLAAARAARRGAARAGLVYSVHSGWCSPAPTRAR